MFWFVCRTNSFMLKVFACLRTNLYSCSVLSVFRCATRSSFFRPAAAISWSESFLVRSLFSATAAVIFSCATRSSFFRPAAAKSWSGRPWRHCRWPRSGLCSRPRRPVTVTVVDAVRPRFENCHQHVFDYNIIEISSADNFVSSVPLLHLSILIELREDSWLSSLPLSILQNSKHISKLTNFSFPTNTS